MSGIDMTVNEHREDGFIKKTIKNAHDEAFRNAQEKFPAMDVSELIDMVNQFRLSDDKKKTALVIAKELSEKYKKPIELYVDIFTTEIIDAVGEEIFHEDVWNEISDGFAEKVKKFGKNASGLVISFSRKEIDEIQFLKKFNGDYNNLAIEFAKSCNLKNGGITDEKIINAVDLAKESASGCVLILSTFALTEAYKILSKALEDAALMHEERLQIEAKCAENISLMREYHEQMNTVVSNYLFEHSETFNRGIESMERAIIENDVDGFIRGNVIIQEVLKYDVQFRNEQEFDSLMDSEIPFKL